MTHWNPRMRKLERMKMNSLLGPLVKFITERAKTVVSKKVGASAIGVSLISSGQDHAGWACIVYAAIQGCVDCFKYWVDNRK